MGTNFEGINADINIGSTAPRPLEIKDFKPENTPENNVLYKKNEILHQIRQAKNTRAKIIIALNHITGQGLV